ncbi:MAG: hypothetical protein LQ344_006899 [Seirophora lacunosa]|nr:MAG: hypothetical protein LQ344_006899 [Seirophora lacunosa]
MDSCADVSEKRPASPAIAPQPEVQNVPREHTASPAAHANTPGDTVPQLPQQDSGDDVAPPKPPRPANPLQQAEDTLKEAFPSIDSSVVRAVLRASGGNVEPAFNALLEMSDPDAQKDEAVPPPQPPRRPTAPTTTAQSQLASDEQYARQLAEHYNGAAPYAAPRGSSRGRQNPPMTGPTRTGRREYEAFDDDRERSFIDDDLPVIRDNIKKGFLETQSKVNSWVAVLKKKIDGEEDDDFQGRPIPAATGYSAGVARQSNQSGFGRRSGEHPRRSADHDRYDADPQVLGDDFTNLQLRDDDAPPRRSSRPLANPDLFKPTPPHPHSNTARRVSFQDGPPEEIGVQQRPTSPPDPTKRPSSGASAKSSKWQPLASVDPNPIADHDPFSLGDSDDEETKKKEVKPDESERLKRVADEQMAGDSGSSGAKEPEPQEGTGTTRTIDQKAEKLTGTSAT